MSKDAVQMISQQTIIDCQAGIAAAERKLYDALLPYLRKVATRYLNDQSYLNDVLQDAFIQLFKYLRSFDSAKGSIESWSARITINVALRYNRKADPLRIRSLTHELIEQYTAPPTSVDHLTDRELLSLLRKMPSDYYTVFNLSVIEEYSHAEIASLMKITEANSRKKLSRAKNWLRKRFVTSSLPFLLNAL